MKAAPLLSVVLAASCFSASAQEAAKPGALLQGYKFQCAPTNPDADVSKTALLTCLVKHDAKQKLPAILDSGKLVGSVHGKKVTWERVISAAGESVELDAKGGPVMASELPGKAVPRALSVHVMRDLALN